MEKHVYPCRSCAQEWQSNCKSCPEWQRWYFYRQRLINEKAAQIREENRCWRYELPLHPVRKKG